MMQRGTAAANAGNEMLRQMGDEMVAPSCTGLAEIQFKYRIGWLFSDISRIGAPERRLEASQPTGQP
jgi:hypothetical protein